MDNDITRVLDLLWQVGAWIAGIWIVLWVITKLTKTNREINEALAGPQPCRSYDPSLDEELEEFADRAHA